MTFFLKKIFKVHSRFIIVLFLSVLLELSGFWVVFSKSIGVFFTPLSILSTQLIHKVSTPLFYLKNVGVEAQYVHELEISHSKLLAKVSEIDAVKKENEAFRKLLENTDRKKERRLITSPITSYTYPSIALGSVDGIRKGQPIFFQDTLLGTIQEVQDTHSEVKLLVSKVNEGVVVETESGVEGLLVGTGRRVILSYVPNSAELVVGERVVTAENTGIKKGLFIGVISSIIDDPTSLHRKAQVKQLVSFNETSVVEVVVE